MKPTRAIEILNEYPELSAQTEIKNGRILYTLKTSERTQVGNIALTDERTFRFILDLNIQTLFEGGESGFKTYNID